MYLEFFGLREMPFSITPDPAYLYMSPRHQEALGHLLYGTGQYGGFVQLTGEVGTGKTTVVRTLLTQKIDGVDVAMVHNPRQSEREFLASVCDELGAPYGDDASLKTLIDALNRHLLDVHARGRRTVLIIDEAQNLEAGVLEQIRLLTNLETHKEKLLRIMLIGQPELADLLARPDLRQLAQRITARYHLMPLSEAETREYIHHRLRVAGGDPELFPADAIRAVQEHSRGVPRLINIVCDRTLMGAYAAQSRRIDGALVHRAAAEALASGSHRAATGWRGRWQAFLRDPDRRFRLLEGALAALAVALSLTLLYRSLSDGDGEAVPSTAEASVALPTPAAEPAPVATPPAPAQPPNALTPALLPLGTLFRTLVQEWDRHALFESMSTACAELREQDYECLRQGMDWDGLRRLDLPAILELDLQGNRKHVLLRWLDDENAWLRTARGWTAVPLAELDALWSGDALLLWKRPIQDRLLDRQSRGNEVVWLRKRLADIAGRPASEPVSGFFDAPLEDTVRAFQATHGLDADGVVGFMTLIALNRGQPGVLSLERPADVAAP